MHRLPISGATRLAGVIGDPARHSLSPAIHNAAFGEVGADWVYLAFDVAPDELAAAVEAMRVLDIGGLSVTMPHKEAILALVDEVAPEAQQLRAANCIVNDNGVLRAHNTDGDGFIYGAVHDTGVHFAGSRVAVLGAGGAARAVVEALRRHDAAEVVVINRNEQRAVDAAALAPGVARVGSETDVTQVDVVVNATPVGMTLHEVARADEVPCDPSLLHDAQTVIDLIYSPSETSWLRQAAARGARTANGLSMLVFQAVAQFTLWTGEPAPSPTMHAAVLGALEARDEKAKKSNDVAKTTEI